MKYESIRRGLSTIVLLVLVHGSTLAAEDDGWLHEFDEASAAAQRDGKDLLIDFSGTDWCGPCQKLWNQTLSKPEFIERAGRQFVLLDVDNLAVTAMPEGRKARYEALQERYGIQAFPTVVLATAEGLPYAATGMLEDKNNPLAYWQHLEPLFERGQKFKAALAAAGGSSDAESIVAALCEVRPDFVARFYSDKLDRLRKLTPPDATGYLAFIDTRTALTALEWKLHEGFLAAYDQWSGGKAIKGRWLADYSPRDVEAIIEKHRPQDAALQEALLARAFLEIDAAQWSRALATLEALSKVEAPPSRFEQADFVRISIRSPEELREHVRAAQASGDPLAQLRGLYGIVRNDVQCVTSTSCCNHSFTTQVHYLVAGAAYGELLLDTTAQLPDKERAAAIGKGLEGIDLFANGSIGRIVCDLMPELVGKEAAIKYLPDRYAEWLRD